MTHASLIAILGVAVVAIECSGTSVMSGSCNNGACAGGNSTEGIDDGYLSMLQMGKRAPKANTNGVSQQEPEDEFDHVKGVSKENTPWLHSDEYYIDKTPLVYGYHRMDGDCPWNNIKVSEKTSVYECASLCDSDCSCLGYSWAKEWGGRCITKSKSCKEKDVWKNVWTFYAKLPMKLCTAKRCSAWGDPHYTETFYGGKPDIMSKGLFLIARNKDKTFELQGFQGPLGWGSAFAGFAIKLGEHRVTIVGKEVRVDGHFLDKEAGFPSWMNFTNVSTEVQSPDFGVSFRSFYKDGKSFHNGPGFYHNMNLVMPESEAGDEGACGAPIDEPIPVHRDDALFSDKMLDFLCHTTGSTNCFVEEEPKGAEETCKEKGVSYDEAVAKCQSLKTDAAFFNACTFDYCATDGNEELTNMAVKIKEAQVAFAVSTTTSEPPLNLVGCFKDSWDRDLPVDKGTCYYPAECKKLCEGYKYSAIQAGVECWCGDDYGKHGKADDCECDNPDWKALPWRSCVYGDPKES